MSRRDTPSSPTPKVTVTLGPAPYTEDLLAELTKRDLVERAIRLWPEFTVDRWDTDRRTWSRIYSLPVYAYLVRAVWATWRRIPHLGRYRTPQTLLFSVFDRLAARQLGHPELFLGWAQVSLHSMRAARRRGCVAALEHPMLHVETWQETMAEEYARWAPDAAAYYSLFPSSLVQRMLAEYREADYIVVPSGVTRGTFLSGGVAPERIVEVPFGIDTDFFRAHDSPRSSRFRVLFIGRLELLKGLHYLLEAWTSLGLKDATLSLVGPVLPEMRSILSAAMGLGSIEVLGQLPREGLGRLFRESHAVVFPSICDAFGLVILEAMASARPVVATSRSAGPDVITDGVDGFVVPPKDAKALAERLEWLYSHREECAEMGLRARRKVEGSYDLASYGRRLERAYGRMISSPVPAS